MMQIEMHRKNIVRPIPSRLWSFCTLFTLRNYSSRCHTDNYHLLKLLLCYDLHFRLFSHSSFCTCQTSHFPFGLLINTTSALGVSQQSLVSLTWLCFDRTCTLLPRNNSAICWQTKGQMAPCLVSYFLLSSLPNHLRELFVTAVTIGSLVNGLGVDFC